ncbi:hypothetical protein VTH06DRAFT_1777 [Thermothelomyces fergusii]
MTAPSRSSKRERPSLADRTPAPVQQSRGADVSRVPALAIPLLTTGAMHSFLHLGAITDSSMMESGGARARSRRARGPCPYAVASNEGVAGGSAVPSGADGC